jgi:hypothetical protein
MSDAEILVSEAGRALAARRWGTAHLDRLVSELRDRADELGDKQLSELQDLLDEAAQNASG